jgi:hypothetical protein
MFHVLCSLWLWSVHPVREYPPNADFNHFGPSGLANLSAAIANVPFYMSKPHFLDGDPSLRARVSGITPPVRSVHDTYEVGIMLALKWSVGLVMDFFFLNSVALFVK